MRTMKLTTLLAAVGILTIAGVGNSAGQTEAVVKMQDFVRKDNLLVGYVGGGTEVNLGYLKRLENTAHLPGIAGPNYPPNPCNAHIKVYNVILDKVPAGSGRLNATLSVLSNMARANCCVDVRYDSSADPTQAPADLATLQPIACAGE